MREASLILPLRDNDGRPVIAAHEALQHALAHAFGGFTYERVSGGWLHDGRLYRDASRRYTVGADWDEAKRHALRLIAAQAGKKARQLSVYLTDDRGEASILPI